MRRPACAANCATGPQRQTLTGRSSWRGCWGRPTGPARTRPRSTIRVSQFHFDELVETYLEAIDGLVQGGADLRWRKPLRYAPRQGGGVCHSAVFRRQQPDPAGDDFPARLPTSRRHVNLPDHRASITAWACQCIVVWSELCTGSDLLRQYVEVVGRLCPNVAVGAPECRSAQRVWRIRSDAGGDGA